MTNSRTNSPSNVIVVLGSPADASWGDRITKALAGFGLTFECRVASAHKTPRYLMELLTDWESHVHPHVYVTVAGRSNALSAFIDAQVTAPVIACPPASEAYAGMDILSSLRMPRGVAPLVVLEPENAALAAAKILATADATIRERIEHSQASERNRVMGKAE